MKPWHRKKVVSFLASTRGLLFSSVVNKIINKEIRAKSGCVITDNPSAPVLDRAKQLYVPAYVVDPEQYSSRESHEEDIVSLLDKFKTDLVVTAGYLRMLSEYFVKQYRNRIINIHPSLLPSFPGIHSQKKALEYGVKITGCTAHFVDKGMDTGPIIMQVPVMVHEQDTVETLSMKIMREESVVISESVRLFCENKLDVIVNKVIIRG
ncbi:MAG: phosphoribosylglycinamide formyltransferase [Spirochaetes bacterium]|nr:phosphoribosylglycinamide formyltransferase [Spirochaetota bacterium]